MKKVLPFIITLAVVFTACGKEKKVVSEPVTDTVKPEAVTEETAESKTASKTTSVYNLTTENKNIKNDPSSYHYEYNLDKPVTVQYSDQFIPFDPSKPLPPVMFAYADQYDNNFKYKFYSSEDSYRFSDGIIVYPVCLIDEGKPIANHIWVKVFVPSHKGFGYIKLSTLSEYKIRADVKNFDDEQKLNFFGYNCWAKTSMNGKLDFISVQIENENELWLTDYTQGINEKDNSLYAEIKGNKIYTSVFKSGPKTSHSFKIVSDDEILIDGKSYTRQVYSDSSSYYGDRFNDIYNGKTYMQKLEELYSSDLRKYAEAFTPESEMIKTAMNDGAYCGGTKYQKEFDKHWKEKFIAADENIPIPELKDNKEVLSQLKVYTDPLYKNYNRCNNKPVPDEYKPFYSSYGKGKLLTTMMVKSDVLQVRAEPDSNSNVLGEIPQNFVVTITAIGEAEKIDNIYAPWIEILLPRFMWHSDEMEFGWVFGGHLKNFDHSNGFTPFSFNGSGKIPEKAGYIESDWESYFNPQFDSPELYSVDKNGNTVLDVYYNDYDNNYRQTGSYGPLSKHARDIENAENEIKTKPMILKMINAGIHKAKDVVYIYSDAYWHRIQQMRQIYPCDFYKDKYIHSGDSKIDNLVEKNFINKDYEIHHIQHNGKELYFVVTVDKFHVNEVMYYEEINVYHLDGNEFIKVYSKVTNPEVITENEFSISSDSGELTFGFTCFSALEGMTHDDVDKIVLTK